MTIRQIPSDPHRKGMKAGGSMKRDFLDVTDFTTEEIWQVLRLAADLKRKQKKGRAHPVLKGKTLAMIFQKPSTRTRISFETGMFQLGGHGIYISPDEMGLGKREAVADVARVLSRYNDGIMARVFEHGILTELAKHASIPVVNGLSDWSHPCQILGDMLTIYEHRGCFDGLKVAWIGDGNNVAHSWIHMAMRIPIELALACPAGYDPDRGLMEQARKAGGSKIEIFRDPEKAAAEADVLYTDVWASMGQEKEAAKRKRAFRNFQINDKLVRRAKPNVLVMHCLPAHRGEEISESALEGPRSIVFDEAENRLHVQKAILVKLLK
jgi:ornithine carbamoyltransferase